MGFKSGFVTIVGRPNVGKSTLLNRLTGEKIAITSDKPQTTRNTIKSIVTTENCQIIFIDTPGVHKPQNKLGELMMEAVNNTLSEVDIVLYVIDARDTQIGEGDRFIIDMLKQVKSKVFLVINKIDLVKKEQIVSIISNYKEQLDLRAVIPISAINGDGIDIILKELENELPEGPKYFPDDMLTDQPEKNIAAELIREKILYLVRDEVPHGVGVEVIHFKERSEKNIIDIKANIYCEKKSHKGILIGKQGQMLKNIGSLARADIENLLGTKVFLELWVKVKPDWRNDDFMLKNLGYK